MHQAFSALLLAQGGANPDAAAVPQLPPPPWIEATLFESPWTGMVVLVAVGAVALWWFNRMQQGKTGAIVLAGTLAAAVGLFLTARFVTTEREELAERTEALVGAVAKADLDRISGMLAPDVRVTVFGRDRGFTADSIPRWVDDKLRPGTGLFAVGEYSVGQLAATIDGSNSGRTQCRVRVIPERIPAPTGSWWRLTWRKDGASAGGAGGAWRVTQIEALQVDGVGEGADVNVQSP